MIPTRRGIVQVQNAGEEIICAECKKKILYNAKMFTSYVLSIENKFFHSSTCAKVYITKTK